MLESTIQFHFFEAAGPHARRAICLMLICFGVVALLGARAEAQGVYESWIAAARKAMDSGFK